MGNRQSPAERRIKLKALEVALQRMFEAAARETSDSLLTLLDRLERPTKQVA